MSNYQSEIVISRSLGQVPEARVTLYDTDEIQAILSAGISTYVYTANIDLPDNKGSLSITGKITDYTINLTGTGLVMTFIVLAENSFFNDVHVAAAVADDLLSDLDAVYTEDITLSYTIQNGLTSGQLANTMAQQAGVTLFWDSGLDYEVVNLLHPVFYFKGTFQKGLETLLQPFNVSGHVLYSVVVALNGDNVSVYRTGTQASSAITITGFNIGQNSFFVGTPTIHNTVPSLPEKLDYWYCEPKTLIEKQEIYTSEVRDGITDNLLSQTTETRTMLGNVILKNEKETSKDHNGLWGISSIESLEYIYDPVPDPENIFYREDMKLLKTSVQRELYIVVDDNHMEIEKSESENSGYLYKDISETDSIPAIVLAEESRTKETFYEAGSSKAGVKEGEISVIQYSQISDSTLETVKNETKYTLDSNASPSYLETIIITTAIKPGAMPTPSVVSVNTEGLVDTFENSIVKQGNRITGISASVEFPFNPEVNGIIDDVQDRINKQRIEMTANFKSNYDLQEGSWVVFNIQEDIKIITVNELNSRDIWLSELFSLLPDAMLVTSVEINRRGGETVCNAHFMGWK